jgi:hypothetical protein
MGNMAATVWVRNLMTGHPTRPAGLTSNPYYLSARE